MPTTNSKKLYRLTIPRDSQQTGSASVQRNVSATGALTNGVSPVESVSVQPGQKSLSGQYRGSDAERLAEQFQELFDSQDITVVPYYWIDGKSGESGYYALNTADTSRADSRFGDLFNFSGTLTKEGTRQSHFRSVTPNITQVDNPFGTTQEATFGVPAEGQNVRWFDKVSGDIQQTGAPDTTVEIEVNLDTAVAGTLTRNVDLYDANSAPFSEAVLIFDLPYSEEGLVDVKAWDTLDVDGSVEDKLSTEDGVPVLDWQRVFTKSHDYSGSAVIENGRFKVSFNVSDNTLSAERWNSSTQAWESVSLGTSDWQVYDFDLIEASESFVSAQVWFEDTTSTDVYPVNFTLNRGTESALWTIPANEGNPFPAGLETKLSPIARGEVLEAGAEQGIIQRADTRK